MTRAIRRILRTIKMGTAALGQLQMWGQPPSAVHRAQLDCFLEYYLEKRIKLTGNEIVAAKAELSIPDGARMFQHKAWAFTLEFLRP
jgi:hypothetical protein